MKKKLAFLIVGCCWALISMAQSGEYKKAFSSGESYKYNCTGKDVGTLYKLPFYEDMPSYVEDDWKTAYGTLGYGESYINTPIDFGSDPENKVITTYIITSDMSFDNNGIEFDSLFLKVRYDDGFVAYINGIEVARRNLSPLAMNTSTATSEHEGLEYELIDITPFKASIITQGSFFAAEVHQNLANSDDLAFDFEVIYYKSTPLYHSVTRKPYLMMGTPSSVEVRWQTSTPSASSLSFGTDATALDQELIDTNQVTEHKMTVTGLDPDTRYYYEINDEPTFLNEVVNQYFHTNPVAGTERKYRFWVLGDFGDGSPNQLQVLTNYTLNNVGKFTDAWLWLGDNAYTSGTQGEYQSKVFNIYPSIFRNTMTYPCPGNHDLGSAVAATQSGPYFENFDVPCHGEAGGVPSNTEAYYSYDYGNIHFISLESTQSNRTTDGEMARWLARDLAANTQKWTIAYWHHPPYTKGSHNSDTEGNLIEMREYICPILEQYGVDLVMTGHSHTYERSYMLDGHYGYSPSLADSMLVYGHNDGRMNSDGPYLKPTENNYSHKGTVYFVNGTGGSLSTGEEIDHPAIFKAIEAGGSVLLEINGDTLTSTFSNATDPTNDDQFTIIKSKAEPCIINFSLGADTTIHNGDNVVLNAGNRFLKYEWSTGEKTEKISVNQAGQYICKVSSSQSCTSADTINVLVDYDAAVNLGQDTIICQGSELTLKAAEVFKSYLWNTGDTTSSIVVNSPGIYTVQVTAFNTTTAIDTIVVDVKDIPVVSISTLANTYNENEEVSFTANGTAENYRWDFGDFATAEGSAVSHAYPIAGVYQVVLSASNANCSGTAQKSITVVKDTAGTGINTAAANNLGLLIFPNPADESITVNIDNLMMGDIEVKIFNESGKLMYSKNYRKGLDLGQNEITIDVDDWASGLYYLVASNKMQSSRSKFIIGDK